MRLCWLFLSDLGSLIISNHVGRFFGTSSLLPHYLVNFIDLVNQLLRDHTGGLVRMTGQVLVRPSHLPLALPQRWSGIWVNLQIYSTLPVDYL